MAVKIFFLFGCIELFFFSLALLSILKYKLTFSYRLPKTLRSHGMIFLVQSVCNILTTKN